jgi:hypothetical protein
LNRRAFIRSIGAAGAILAAPAIVRAASLMPVKPLADLIPCDFSTENLIVRSYERWPFTEEALHQALLQLQLYGQVNVELSFGAPLVVLPPQDFVLTSPQPTI